MLSRIQFRIFVENIIILRYYTIQRILKKKWLELKKNPQETYIKFLQNELPSILSILLYVFYFLLITLGKNFINLSASFLNEISFDSLRTLISRLFEFLKNFMLHFNFLSVIDWFYSIINFFAKIINNLDTQVKYVIQSTIRILKEPHIFIRLKVFYVFFKGKIKNLKLLIRIRLIIKPILELFLCWIISLHLKSIVFLVLSLLGFKLFLDSMLLSFLFTLILQQICTSTASLITQKLDNGLGKSEVYLSKWRNIRFIKIFYK